MRTKHFTSALLLVTSLTLLGAGCGQTTSEPTATTKEPVAKGSAYSDACGNPYYPFKPGLAIAYKVSPSTGAEGDSDYTIRTLSVSGTTAKTRTEMAGGVTADMEADCASGSVELKGSSNLDAAAQGVGFKTTVLASSGTFMPSNVSAGTVWNNSETILMEFTEGASASMGPITSTTTEQSRAIGEESVTVPAGTYTAIKVELTRTITSKFSGGPKGIKLPAMPPTTVKSTEWWVKGIGMVKSVTVSEGQTSTVEAKSITGQ